MHDNMVAGADARDPDNPYAAATHVVPNDPHSIEVAGLKARIQHLERVLETARSLMGRWDASHPVWADLNLDLTSQAKEQQSA